MGFIEIVWSFAKPIWEKHRLTVIVGMACLFFGGCVGCKVGGWKARIVGDAETGDEVPVSFGWKPDPDAVRKVLSELPRPIFKDAAPQLFGQDEGKDALLYLLPIKAGQPMVPHNQGGVGCCVGEGFAYAAEVLQWVQIQGLKQPHEFFELSSESIYALSRVEIGGGKINGDGSVGAWAAKAMNTKGALGRRVYKDGGQEYDLTKFSESRARQWGDRGLPDGLEPEAAKHKVKTVSLVRTADEIRRALVNGYPVSVCSDQGFTMTRDKDGFCRAKGSWAHCMAVVGYRADRRAFLIAQSWGANTPSGPTSLDQPSNTFWIEWGTMDRMARQGDTWALSGFDGFPRQDIDWQIVHMNRQRAQPAQLARTMRPRFTEVFALAH